jgi:hypothetical protein
VLVAALSCSIRPSGFVVTVISSAGKPVSAERPYIAGGGTSSLRRSVAEIDYLSVFVLFERCSSAVMLTLPINSSRLLLSCRPNVQMRFYHQFDASHELYGHMVMNLLQGDRKQAICPDKRMKGIQNR